jgi:hypothetical protein
MYHVQGAAPVAGQQGYDYAAGRILSEVSCPWDKGRAKIDPSACEAFTMTAMNDSSAALILHSFSACPR